MAYNLTGYIPIIGTPSSETLNGTKFNDAIYSNGGVDTLFGGDGADVLFGSNDGSTTFIYSRDAVWASNYQATDTNTGQSVNLNGYGRTYDVYVGSGANNVLNLGNNKQALFLDDPISPGADNVRLVNIQTINGGDKGQIIDLSSNTVTYGSVTINGGTNGDNFIVGNAGDDTLNGGTKNDYLSGGAGNDALNGGAGQDRLFGGTGNDTLDGGTGNDTMTGGTGDDTYFIDTLSDTILEAAGEGTDTVVGAFSYVLSANLENLTLTGTANLSGTGNASNNVIIGNSGSNTLDGGAGSDTLRGGAGDDTYIVDTTGDQIIENAGEGTDTVQSSATYTLGVDIENLTLTGSTNIDGTGNGLDNVIAGNSGANTLDGGAGNDTMSGGSGDDTYIVDSAGDAIAELSGQGTDTVRSALSYTLGANLENLVLTGTAANGTGNDLDNAITGNGANNTLDGGAGNDALAGGGGNDTYVIDSAGDQVIENAGEGTDLVMASVAFALGNNLENLTLTGSLAISAVGNALDNILTGNGAANLIDGGGGHDTIDGGAGADTLAGGTGNDTYIVDDAGDAILENANEGIDIAKASVSYTISGNVENLTLTGSAAISGTGNALDNQILGNAASNVIDGQAGNDKISGGDGHDTIYGGIGNDTIFGDEGNDTIHGGDGHDQLNGGARNDTIYGGTGNDGLWGGGGNDVLHGEDGTDWLFGDGGNDAITGGAGDDAIAGGAQNDQLTGGAGNDTYFWQRADVFHANGAWAGYDTITDFGAGDRLDLSGIFKNLPAQPMANMVHVTDTAGGTVISASINGGATFLDVVVLSGQHLDLDDLVDAGQLVV